MTTSVALAELDVEQRAKPAPAAILVVEADVVLGAALVEQLIADGYRAELARTTEHARSLAAERVPKLAVIGELDSPRGALGLLGEIREADWGHVSGAASCR
jgi:DNA-binding response OmpR family regulator